MAWRGEGKLVPWAHLSSRASLLSCLPDAPQRGVLEVMTLHPTVSELSSCLGDRLGLLQGVLLIQGMLHRHCVELAGEVCG